MSIDIQVWAVKPAQLNCLRKRAKWQSNHSAWTHVRRDWQIVVSASKHAQAKDVPGDINKVLPGILWETDLNLEGKAYSKSLRLLHATADDLARSTHGLVFDPQDSSIRLPSGLERPASPRSGAISDVISMSWWFLESPIESQQGRGAFVELLERNLPESLPRRYGLFEPPDYIYDRTGKEHFLQFLEDNLHDIVIWYPHRPVVGVYLALPLPRGAHKEGFRTNHLRIDIEREVVREPGWAVGLMKFWQEVSTLIRPIYGDVRAVSGHKWISAPISPNPCHPVTSCFWVGIPERLGLAVVLGDAYQILWPSFASRANLVDGLAFASLDDWQSEGDLTEQVGPPPQDQLLRPESLARIAPSVTW